MGTQKKATRNGRPFPLGGQNICLEGEILKVVSKLKKIRLYFKSIM